MADVASPNVSNTETENSPASPLATPKKSKTKSTSGAKRPVKKTEAKKSVRPKTSDMVYNAIKELNDRKGSSLQAIKKHISATHTIDAEKMALFIRKYLKSAVASGELTQTKGAGASGSFKIAQAEKKTTDKSSGTVLKKKVVKKESKTASPKKVVKAKTVADKKRSVKTSTKKSLTPKKSVKSKVTKTSKLAPKEKKSAKKLPTLKKAKSPKVKKVPASKSKKASPKKN